MSIVVLILFTFWIIPLGVFIKPEQEKKACNGRRAICMCTHMLKKKLAKMDGKTFWKKGSGVAQDQGNTLSFGQEFVLAGTRIDMPIVSGRLISTPRVQLDQYFIRLIDHVPKA